MLEGDVNFLRLVSRHSLNRGLNMRNLISAFLKNDSGATAIEYGLIAALIAVVIIGAITAVGTSLSTTFSSLSVTLR